MGEFEFKEQQPTQPASNHRPIFSLLLKIIKEKHYFTLVNMNTFIKRYSVGLVFHFATDLSEKNVDQRSQRLVLPHLQLERECIRYKLMLV